MKNKVTIPDDTVDLKSELVPAVRSLLRKGLSESFMTACLRIDEFETFSGGLKADLVGGIKLRLNTVIKLGGAELELHKVLMNAVNKREPMTFAEVLRTVLLDDQRMLLIMAELREYKTFFDMVFQRNTEKAALFKILDKTFAGLNTIHTTTLRHDGFETTLNPYSRRIRDALIPALEADSVLAPILDKPGSVMGAKCPPLSNLLNDLDKWLEAVLPAVPKVLIHGDLHLRNVMARGYGRGFNVKFIDPNPDYGYTDRIYDLGKLLHFAEPVGWIVTKPSVCHGVWKSDNEKWRLTTKLHAPKQAENRRAFIEQAIHAQISKLDWLYDETWESRLHVARASAHLGLLAILSSEEDDKARRFVLAHAVAALAAWHNAVGK